MAIELARKKVLLMGLGILGGGVATARFLHEHGAELTVTDMKSKKDLDSSLRKLDDIRKDIRFVLGAHRYEDFLNTDLLVVNPDVPLDNEFVKLAKHNNKQIENELSLFYRLSPTKKITAITGTRGKTTTTNWVACFIKTINPSTFVIGNSPDNPFLSGIYKSSKNSDIVIETPSFQLELMDSIPYAPHVAIITNLYQDHISRHKSMREYALAKANIFKYQKEDDFLILNLDDDWTPFFENLKPKSKILYFSKNMLPINKEGAYINEKAEIVFKINKSEKNFMNISEFKTKWGEHNVYNLLSSSLAAHILGVRDANLRTISENLPQIKFRQEKVYENDSVEIYNDTTATSPEATMAAISRFKNNKDNLILITGGTDKELKFEEWAKKIKEIIKPRNLLLLRGSATEKMKKELRYNFFNEFEDLRDCIKEAIKIANSKENKTIILFSPSSKSFEKFKNEFDRGEKFNKLLLEEGLS